MNHNTKTISFSIVILLLATYAHTFLPETKAQEEALVSPEVVSAGSGVVSTQAGGEMLALLASMRTIRLDESLFSDPKFQSLQDFSVSLNPEPKGRPNPFAPLGQDAAMVELPGFATASPVRAIPFKGAGG